MSISWRIKIVALLTKNAIQIYTIVDTPIKELDVNRPSDLIT